MCVCVDVSVLCLAKVQCQVDSAPSWANDIYLDKVKYSTALSAADRATCLENLMKADVSSTFWEQYPTTEHIADGGEHEKWISWTALLRLEDDTVAKLAIECKRIPRRPSVVLDHGDPRVNELDWV